VDFQKPIKSLNISTFSHTHAYANGREREKEIFSSPKKKVYFMTLVCRRKNHASFVNENGVEIGNWKRSSFKGRKNIFLWIIWCRKTKLNFHARIIWNEMLFIGSLSLTYAFLCGTHKFIYFITDVVVVVFMKHNPPRFKLLLSKAPCIFSHKSGWIKIFSFVFKWNLFLCGGVFNPIYCFILLGIIMASSRIIGKINKRTFSQIFLFPRCFYRFIGICSKAFEKTWREE
jgi:hypothetical protein